MFERKGLSKEEHSTKVVNYPENVCFSSEQADKSIHFIHSTEVFIVYK